MYRSLCTRLIAALICLSILFGMLPANTFAEAQTISADMDRATADLTSAIDALTPPIAQTNALLDNLTVSNTGLVAGTYYLVHKDAGGTYRIMDPLDLANGTTIIGKPITVSGNSVVDADPSMAIDLTYNNSYTNSNEYYFITSDGRHVRNYVSGTTPCLVVGNSRYYSFGVNFYSGSAYQAHSVRIYRRMTVSGASPVYDMQCTDGNFGWIPTVSGQFPITHQFFLYKIAQRWDTSELYNAIQTMKSYASANNGRFAEGIHAAFMDCMEKSIELYTTYNVATGSQTYEEIVAIRSELEAQAQWLLSYQPILQASYADAAAAIPTPTNSFVPISWAAWQIDLMSQLRGGTYFIVNPNADMTGGHLVDLSQAFTNTDLIASQTVTISDGKIINADPN